VYTRRQKLNKKIWEYRDLDPDPRLSSGCNIIAFQLISPFSGGPYSSQVILYSRDIKLNLLVFKKF